MQKFIILTVIFLVALAVAAVPLRPLDDEAGHVIVASDSLAFDVAEIEVEEGREVEIILDNSQGSTTHTFTIEAMPVDGVHPESDESDFVVHIVVEGGEETSVTFTPTEAGSYRYFCSVPGHADAGMVGTLVVE